jgi:hypothetical protein
MSRSTYTPVYKLAPDAFGRQATTTVEGTILYATNDEAEMINDEKLRSLPGVQIE